MSSCTHSIPHQEYCDYGALEAEVTRLRGLVEIDKDLLRAYETLYKKEAVAQMFKQEAELAAHGKGKCVPADEFEKAKEPIFAEGMRAGCEDLMREAARMDEENARLREQVKAAAKDLDRWLEYEEVTEAELASARADAVNERGKYLNEKALRARLREKYDLLQEERDLFFHQLARLRD